MKSTMSEDESTIITRIIKDKFVSFYVTISKLDMLMECCHTGIELSMYKVNLS